MEAVITMLLGIAGYWLLIDFPDSTRKTWNFLGDRERAWVVSKVNADRGDARIVPFKLGMYLRAGGDWKIWAYAMIFFNTTTITYALAYFLPIILNDNMKFTVVQSQCLTAPPYAFAGIVMFLTSWAGDKYRVRGPIIVFNMVLCLIGLPIIGWHSNAAVRYFGVFLTTAGANSNVPATMSYQANNVRGQWKRALTSATLVGFGGVGGIAGSLVFRSQDNPTYRPGMWACIATSLLTILIVGVLSLDFARQNRKADRGEKELETSDVRSSSLGHRYPHVSNDADATCYRRTSSPGSGTPSRPRPGVPVPSSLPHCLYSATLIITMTNGRGAPSDSIREVLSGCCEDGPPTSGSGMDSGRCYR